jgi:hypothetical protein
MSENATPEICRNCHTPLHGDYCSSCGQQENRPDIHFSEVLGDAIGDLFVWDSRFYRTLVPLLLRPGFLTEEHMSGRKVSYVPPIRLYLIISFFLFLLLSLMPTEGLVEWDTDGGGNVVVGYVEPDPEVGEVDLNTKVGANSDSSGLSIDLGGDDANQPAWMAQLAKRFNENAEGLADDPSAFVALLIQRLPQAMFLLLPVFAALVQLCYILSAYHYLQHLIFSLHYHSFVFLLYLVGWLAHRFLQGMADPILIVALLVYLPLALRRVYGSSTVAAIGKSLVIYLSYSFIFIVFMALYIVINLVSM